MGLPIESAKGVEMIASSSRAPLKLRFLRLGGMVEPSCAPGPPRTMCSSIMEQCLLQRATHPVTEKFYSSAIYYNN